MTYDPAKACPHCGDDQRPCYCGDCMDPLDEVAEIWKDRSEPVGRLEGERVVFREWNLNQHLDLMSTARDHQWTLEMEAYCPTNFETQFNVWQTRSPSRRKEVPANHAPDKDCGCGLHAFYDVPDGSRYAGEVNSVVGAIVVSGKTLLGPTGVRAEKARIVLLAYGNERQRVLAEGAAKKLGVGCCKLEDLERLSLEYGQPVPDEEKPKGLGFVEGGMIPATATMRLPAGVYVVGGAAIRIANNSLQSVPGSVGVDVTGWNVTPQGSSGGKVVADGHEWGPKRSRRSQIEPLLIGAWGALALGAGILHGLGGI